jgi:hypothetical protein
MYRLIKMHYKDPIRIETALKSSSLMIEHMQKESEGVIDRHNKLKRPLTEYQKKGFPLISE